MSWSADRRAGRSRRLGRGQPPHMDGRGTLAGSKPSPARAISLASRVTVNGTPPSETNMRADLASRFSVRSATISSLSSWKFICHDLPRIRTLASNNYVRTRWDRSTAKYAAPETPADANCGRNCFGQLKPGATVHPCLKRTRGPTWPRASVSEAPTISSLSSWKFICHDLPRIRTLASNNYVRTRWDRSTAKYAAPETPADAALVAKMTNSSAKASRRFSSNFSTVTKTLQRRSK